MPNGANGGKELTKKDGKNFTRIQKLLNEKKKATSLSNSALTEKISQHSRKFDDRFEETFKLKSKGYNTKEISMAKAAMSNMVGGLG